MPFTNHEIDDAWILAQRSAKPTLDPWRPHAFLVEPERTAAGEIEDVATLFLTNRECPFRCLMCDLWQYTTDHRVPDGAIAAQVEYALARLPPARHLKLYNAGNFFDAQAIPPADHARIAELAAPFATVIVECHPLLVGPRVLKFRDRLAGQLEIAMGLETVHPEVLPRLNKRMTLDDFTSAAHFLNSNEIRIRAFILLKPPFLDEADGIEWAKRSLDFAFDHGVECCAVIPTRAGNGALERLAEVGHFSPPGLSALEDVLAYGIGLRRGRVFADLWDLDKDPGCTLCRTARVQRLHTMNLHQVVPPPIDCTCRSVP